MVGVNKKHSSALGNLTAKGDLYGVSGNYDGQISEEDKYTLPYLMATDVISAAAGDDYTIYVTRDGEVHSAGQR